MRISLLIIYLFFIQPALADVYKSVDEDGNVIFTDQPSENAERIHVKEVQTIESQKPGPSDSPTLTEEGQEQEDAAIVYTKLEITSPANDSAVRANDGNITINTAVEPALKQEAGHQLALYMDGTQVSTGPGPQLNVTNVDRGTHIFSAAVIDSEGNELLRSSSVSFTVQRHSVNKPKPGGPPPP